MTRNTLKRKKENGSPRSISLSNSREKLIIPKKEIKEEREDCISTRHSQNEINLIKGKTVKLENDEYSCGTTTQSNPSFCVICMDSKLSEEMFKNDKCAHSFCSYCVGKYVATKIQENISSLKCPEPKCDGVLEPQLCRSIVPKNVFERWESALCESLVLGWLSFTVHSRTARRWWSMTKEYAKPWLCRSVLIATGCFVRSAMFRGMKGLSVRLFGGREGTSRRRKRTRWRWSWPSGRIGGGVLVASSILTRLKVVCTFHAGQFFTSELI